MTANSSPLVGVVTRTSSPELRHSHLLRVKLEDRDDFGAPVSLNVCLQWHDLNLAITSVEAAEDRVIELFMDHSPRLACAAPIDLAGCLLEACQMVRDRCRGGTNSILIHPDDVPYVRLAFPPPVGQDGGYRNGRWLTFGSVHSMTAFVGDAAPRGAIVVFYNGASPVDSSAIVHPGLGTAFVEPKPGYTDYSHYAAIIDIGAVP